MTPQPTPQPGPTAQPTSVNVGGVTLAAPPSGSSGGDLYGLGSWGGQPVQAGDLGYPITGNTGDDIVKSLGQADPQSVARIQQALLWGGFYTDQKAQPLLGVLRPDDYDALAHAIESAGRAGASVSDVISNAATYGVAHGITAAQMSAASKVTSLPVPSRTDLEYAADQAFLKVAGHRATQPEMAAFATAYTSLVQSTERQNALAVQKAQQTAAQPPAPEVDPATLDPTYDGGSAGAAEHAQEVAAPQPFAAHMATLGDAIQSSIADSSAPLTGADLVPTEQPPDINVAAENFVRNARPQQAASNDLGNALNMFLNIIGGNGLTSG